LKEIVIEEEVIAVKLKTEPQQPRKKEKRKDKIR